MERLRMVPVCRVTDQFEGQILVARLGAAGVVAQLRGAGVDTVDPMGSIQLLVPEEDLSFARELIAADPPGGASGTADDLDDEVDDDLDGPLRTSVRPWHVITAFVVAGTLFLTVIARLLGG